MAATQSFTLIPYLYRDAANYKEHGTLIATGKISREQKEAMQAVLESDDSFIPAQLGLGHLGAGMEGFPNLGDHPWHEIDLDHVETGEGTPETEGLPVGDITLFVNLFVAEGTKGWDGSTFFDA